MTGRYEPARRERITPDRAYVVGDGAVVAAESAAAGRAGAQMLQRGGNAVDAAVALAFCACVSQPAATTVAGSGFLLAHGPAGSWSIEFPPRAPLGGAADMYTLVEDPEQSSMLGVAPVVGDANDLGPLAAGVPGMVAGLCEAHRLLGRLPLDVVVAPAADLASSGFETHPDLQLATLAALTDIRRDPELAALLLDELGAPRIDDFGFADSDASPVLIRQPKLAELLERIGAGGPAAFYEGAFAKRLTSALRDRGGIMSMADLARYRPLVGRPLTLHVDGHALHAPHSPSGAWTALQLLRAWQASDALSGEGAVALHRRVELARHAFADRYHFMGDPEHADVPLAALLSQRHAAALAEAVDDDRARMRFDDDPRQPWNRFAVERPHELPKDDLDPPTRVPAGLGDSRETTHLSVADDEGMIVSCTITAANRFGARVMCEGVLFDDAMIWFNARPGFRNSIAPWKRPLVNMSPLIAERADGARLAVGAPGGRRVTMATVEVTRRWLAGEHLDAAVAAPRVDASGREVLVSPRMPIDLIEGLRERGHPVRLVEDRDPYSYDYARPVAAARDAAGRGEAAVHPHCTGYAAAP